jgi:FkbM family methyltransferase
MKRLKLELIKGVYQFVAKIFFACGYFPGSFRVHNFLINALPLQLLRAKHPIGFTWLISSRDAFRTYISSCEPYTTKVIIENFKYVDTFVCVGANRGWYPLVVGYKNRDTKVYAFECNSRIFRELAENVRQNSLNIELSQLAVGEKISNAKLFMPLDGNDGMATLFPIGGEQSSASIIENVNITTLDDYFAYNTKNFGQGLILMDIEGSEMKALSGASKLLREHQPSLILEINPDMLQASGSSAAQIFKFLREMGYQIHWIDERGRLESVGEDNVLPHLEVLPTHTGANYLFTSE